MSLKLTVNVVQDRLVSELNAVDAIIKTIVEIGLPRMRDFDTLD